MTLSRIGKKGRRARLLFGVFHKILAKPGRATIRLSLPKAAQRRLRHAHGLKLPLLAIAVDPAGNASSTRRSVAVIHGCLLPLSHEAQ